ncbi:MAG: ABC transporter permease [Chloroflexi bacterium]|nr:MAG: ABC transporter permease [Chloroflexota bacterium]
MQRYLLQRLVLVVLVLLGVSVLIFVVTRLTPGDPARVMLGPRATEQQLEQLRVAYGLDQPVYVQYVSWLSHIAHGDLGESIQLHRPVANEVAERFRATLILAIAAGVVAFGLGITFGVVAAVRANSVLDHALMSVALLGISLPPFWIGLIFIITFSLLLRWLPATGMLSPTGGGGLDDVLPHLVLPTISLAVVPLAVIARLTRANMLEVLNQLYVRTARAKGLPPLAVVVRHAFRNALVGTVTLLGLEAGWLLAGTVYIETVFAWPGLGSMLVNAILQRDYPLVQGGVLLVATTYVLINLATDALYVYLDPRLRHA